MRFALLPLLLALAACVAPREAAPPPSPRPAPAPPPPVSPAPPQDWQDAPLAPGQWTWRRDERGSVATFGVAGRDAAFVVRCDMAARTISLNVPGLAAPSARLAITTTDGARTFPVADTGGTPPSAGAALAASDGFLDLMAFTRGRLRVVLGGQAAVILPSGPELARTVEDCRA